MKKVKLIILFALFCVKTDGFSILEDQILNDIIGIYWAPKKEKIEIYSKGLDYYENFVWLKSAKTEFNSPVKFFEGHAALGFEFLGFSLLGPSEIFEVITKK